LKSAPAASLGATATLRRLLVLAGAERLVVEFIRRNDEVLLRLTQPQLFAAAMLAAGLSPRGGYDSRLVRSGDARLSRCSEGRLLSLRVLMAR
jgi:hypothetical protein